MNFDKRYYKGKAYWLVPALDVGSCDGCHFKFSIDDIGDTTCPHNDETSKHVGVCWNEDMDADSEPVWIPATKKAMAEYVLKRMGVTDEPELE